MVLSDGAVLDVRTLGIFELDPIGLPEERPFSYKMKLVTGEEIDVEFDPSLFPEPPEKPDVAENEIEYKSREWYALRTWQYYQAALAGRKVMIRELKELAEKITWYVLENCIDPDDIKRIVTIEDVDELARTALIPQLTLEDVKTAVKNTYHAQYNGMDIMDALEAVSGSSGVYNATRAWENLLMIKMGMTESEYASLPLDERARKVGGMMLKDWFESLEIDKAIKRRKTDGLSGSDQAKIG